MSAFTLYNAGTPNAVYDGIANAAPIFSTYQRTVVAVSGVITQRIEGGSKMYKKNASAKVPFKAVDSIGLGVTGLTIIAKTAKDGANPTTAANAVIESGQGWYYITLTAGEMNGDIVVLDVSASGVTIAPITISTESDYTAARAALLDNADAAISTRASPTNITAGTITTVTNLTNAPTVGDLTATMKASITTAATAATPTLSSAGVTAIWAALTSVLTTTGSIGKKLADWVIGTSQTGDAFARLGAPSGASVSADIAAISVATNAGDLATKQADSATLTTGTTISGTYASTATNDAVYWITAPVTPAVGGFGLREQLVFDLPLGRIPIGIQVRGYFNGSGATVDVYALNSRTAAFDKLTNANTNLASRNSDALYAIPLPRDYADNSGGAFNIVTLEFRSASTNTTHRLRVDQALIAHVAESVAVTSTAPTADQIWSYVTRELTTPGAEPVTVPTAADIRSEMDANSTKLAHLDADISSRSTYAGADTAGTTTLLARVTAAPLLASAYTAPDNAGIAAVKAKTDNLPSDPADASDIAGAFSTVNSTLATIAGYVDTEVAAIKAKTDLIPASPAAISDIPSAAANASAVRTNLTVELGRIDVAVSSVSGSGGSAPTAVQIADEVQTRTLNANIQKVNNITISGTGAPSDTWGP